MGHCSECGKTFSNQSTLSMVFVGPISGVDETPSKVRTKMSSTTDAINALLARYNDALNASSTDAVMPLYTEDGVFMPPYSQSAVGAAAVRKANEAVFKAITLNGKFTIAEIVEVGPGWAFARTTLLALPPTMQRAPRAQKATRNCSSSNRIATALGRLRGTVFRQRIRLGHISHTPGALVCLT